ncbi:ribosomal protein S18-alanine N-acetyltransferase [Lacticaseibacillus parakribbianus]|uniref:ribosomal protein S18-alanine N-acetyltransferase n=1 Tax=Lacticaseibacillus parakribbianus TaxID=2970927 RepID=UPI0021CB791B|nr:ribosomal protein S18-alanine N-acetyltransferase [Lacticaseibacillus parakribbianus]
MLRKFKSWLDHEPPASLAFAERPLTINGVTYTLRRMRNADIDAALGIERAVYQGDTPWDRVAFLSELRKVQHSLYLVLAGDYGIDAFVGASFTRDEAHITNIAVGPSVQRLGIGTALMQVMIDKAYDFGSRQMTLEVRTDNAPAQALYHQLGFYDGAIKPGYYVATHKDAMDMWRPLD